MSDKKVLQSAAVFMISIIVMLPVYISSAFATNGRTGVLEAHAYGQDGLEGYFRPNGADTTTYDILASFGDETPVTLDNLRINQEIIIGQPPICEPKPCDPEEGAYRCNCINTWSPSDMLSISIGLYNDAGARIGYPKSLTLIPDSIAPKFEEFSDSVENTKITINYEIKDEACGASMCINKCAGIKDIVFYDNNNIVETIPINSEPDDCSYRDIWSHDFSEGQHEIYAIVHDNVNNHRTLEKIEKVIDTTRPVIAGTFKILDANGNEIRYISTEGPYSYIENADVVVEITEANNLSEVKADLSSLNPVGNWQNVDGRFDNLQGLRKTARFHMSSIDMQSGQATIHVTATDISELTGERDSSISPPLIVDNAGPEVVFFGTEYCPQDRDECYVKEHDNRLIIRFNEQGVGMHNNWAFININSFGNMYAQSQRVYSCDNPTGQWECYGYADVDENKHTQRLYVSITDMTMDDIGNEVTGQQSWYVIADTSPPDIIGISIVDASGLRASVLMVGQPIRIEANITEKVSGIISSNVIAEIGDLAEGQDEKPATDCSLVDEESHLYTCYWNYNGPLEPGDKTLTIRATDNAGNEATKESGPVHISGEVEGPMKNYWKGSAKVDDFGPAVNKNFLWMSQGTYQKVTITLDSYQGNPFVHGFSVQNCKSEIGAALNYGANPGPSRYVQPNTESRITQDIVFNLPGRVTEEFKQVLEGAEEINITCKIEIIQSPTQTGNIFIPYEKANVSIKIPLLPGVFDNPGDELLRKIENEKKTIEALDKTTKFLGNTINTVQPICRGINAVRQILASVLTLVCTIKWWVGQGTLCETLENVFNKVNSRWYGQKTPGEQANFWMKLSPFSAWSVGFWCQFFLCDQCTNWMDSVYNELLDEGTSWMEWGERTGTLANVNIPEDEKNVNPEDKSNFFERGGPNNPVDGQIGIGDIHNNLILSVMCVPPCLVGIHKTLETYKSILIENNQCMRLSEIFGKVYGERRGEVGLGTCNEVRAGAQCQLITGQLWQAFVARFIQSAMHVAVYKIFDQTVFEWARQCGNEEGRGKLNAFCWIAAIEDTVGLWIEFQKAERAWNDIFNPRDDKPKTVEEQEEYYRKRLTDKIGDPYEDMEEEG